MIVTTSCYYVFGSGYCSASFHLDGKRVHGSLDLGHNGFWGDQGKDIPIDVIRKAREIRAETSADPGGSSSFVGAGRRYIYKRTGSRPLLEDPLLKAQRQRPAKLAKLKQRKAFEAMCAKGLARTVPVGFGLSQYWEKREHFRLPDGSRGGRWVPYFG
jgi:hypothetical protein